MPNVVAIVSGAVTHWFGSVSGQSMYQDIVDGASASVAAGQTARYAEVPSGSFNRPISKEKIVTQSNDQGRFHATDGLNTAE